MSSESSAVPEGWTEDAIGDYVASSLAGEWGSEADGGEDDIPVLRATNFSASGAVDYGKLAIRSIEERKRVKKSLRRGDIVLEKSGGSPTQPVGRVIYFDNETPFLYSNFTQKLSPVDACDSKYFFYKLHYEYQKGTVLKFQQQTTGIINFQLAEYLLYKTVFPPLPEQQKIGSILSSVDDVIEKTTAQIDKLKDLKTGMMQELLTKGIGHTEFKDSPVGRIPVGWDVVEFGDHLDVRSGKGFSMNEYSSDGFRLLRIDNVSWGKITWDSIAYLPLTYRLDYEKLVLESGDILLALNRPITQCKLKIAKITSSDLPAMLYQRVGKILFKDQAVMPNFAYFWLCYWLFDFLNRNVVGSDQPFINISELRKLEMPLPLENEQQRLAKIFQALDVQVLHAEQKLTSVQNTKKALMQDLLTGKVRVSVN